MGPYCNFCGRRCFVLRVIPDGPRQGAYLLLATCGRGMEHDRNKTGHTHATAINPVTDPAAAQQACGPDELDDVLTQVPQHRNDLDDWCPRSGEYTADGACPLFCRHADDIMGIDAGRDEDEPESPPGTWVRYYDPETGVPLTGPPDTLRELREPS